MAAASRKAGYGLYLAIVAALFVGAIAVTLILARNAVWDGPDRIPLLRAAINYTRDNGPGLVVHEVGAVARRANVRAGDRILAIDGLAPNAGLDRVAAAADGETVRLTLKRGTAQVTSAIVLNKANSAAMLEDAGWSPPVLDRVTAVLGLLNGAASIVAAIVLFVRARHTLVAKLITVGALGLIADDPLLLPNAMINPLFYAFYTLINIAILGFPNGRYRGVVGIGLLALNLCLYPITLLGLRDVSTFWPVALATNVAGMWWQLRRPASPIERQQRRWAMIGFSGAALGGLGIIALGQAAYIDNDLAAVIWNDLATLLVDTLTWSLLLGGLTVALLRYRLYDADAVLTRAAIWVIGAPILALIFAVITDVIKQFLVPLLGGAGFAAPIAGALTALLIQPVSDAIKLRVERFARRDLNDLRTDLPAAIEDLRETDDRRLLLDHICARVAPVVRAQSVAIVTAEEERWQPAARKGIAEPALAAWLAGAVLDSGATLPKIERADPLLPLRIPLIARVDGRPRALGWLLVGRRADGSIPDAPAREALAVIAPALGRALHVLAQRERRWQALAQRLQAA